jgi:2-polyprenyl-3-methyl-5-hydroxy-6-metoxy-1,4-benzoquinol methylase
MEVTDEQELNRTWWQQNPMTYDWQGTLTVPPYSRQWFDEIDRRFLLASYFARGSDGTPFGRFLRKEHVAGKDVLEIGCGMGTHAAMLARCGAQLTAIDLTERAVETARHRFEIFGLQGEIQQADAEKLQFPGGSFDFVWSWGVIHHSRSTELILAEITRVLRPGGRILIMVYYKPSLVYYLHAGLIRGILLGKLWRHSLRDIYTAASDGFYARVFTKKELRGLLEPNYTNLRMSIVGLKPELFPMPRTHLKEQLEELTPDWLASAVLSRCGSMIVVEAEKR